MKRSVKETCCASKPPRRLNELPSGSRAVVHHIETAEKALHRLMAMGLCVGREIKVVRQGNPLILGLLGARIGVSSRLAQHVVVQPACRGSTHDCQS
ncbi:MAG: ferrous iron transport protein A [Verrucomicrobia bacterium]|nr:ferrous iron transport protein A [Verrucomicrobiota bacterium]